MATVKRGAPTPAERKRQSISIVKAAPIEGRKRNGELTRKAKRVINKATYRKAQLEEFDAHKAKKPVLQKTKGGKGAIVIHGATPKPVAYDPEIGKKICIMFATDPTMDLLRLNADPTLPTVWSFYEWLHDHPEFDKAYARARSLWCDIRAAQIVHASQLPLIGTITVKRTGGRDGDTTETREFDKVDRARLAVETQKWLLARESPKKYGVQPVDPDSGNDALQELLAQFRSRSQEIENAS
jgi:hypothetical protein